MAFTDAEIAETHQAVREVGHSEDLYKLGLIYATGQGGDTDLVQAHMWFNLAASRGFEAAKESRRDVAVAKELTGMEQIWATKAKANYDKAQQLANEAKGLAK